MPVTGAEVFAAVAANRRIVKQMGGPEALEQLRSDIEALPGLLGDRVDEPLTFQLFLDASYAFVEHLLTEGALADAYKRSRSFFGGMGRMDFSFREPTQAELLAEAMATAKEALANAFGELLELFNAFQKDPAFALKTFKASSDRDALTKLGLDRGLRKRALAGTLTLADLLREQPEVIVAAVH